MKKEYREFLKNLKNELLTQPTDGNANPRYWGIRVKDRKFGLDSDYADGWGVYDDEQCEDVGVENDIQSVIDEFVNDYEMSADDFAEDREKYCYMDKNVIEDVVSRANEVICSDRFRVCYYKDEYKIIEDALFLTKKACQEHIERNHYNLIPML